MTTLDYNIQLVLLQTSSDYVLDLNMPLIASLLDTDLYKLTMQAAVLDHFKDAHVKYGLTNRTPDLQLTEEAVKWLRDECDSLGSLRFTPQEIEFLGRAVPHLPVRYLEYLRDFQLKPKDHLTITFHDRELSIEVHGPWVDTILYEIPLLALVSEAYFKFVDTDWNYYGQRELAADKAQKLLDHGCVFSEFGTRRRRSLKAQELVLQEILTRAKDDSKFLGTSNVYFAMKYNLKPIGTVAHEWMMGIASYTQDYVHANLKSMEYWLETMGKEGAGLVLTDTFGTDNFLKCE